MKAPADQEDSEDDIQMMKDAEKKILNLPLPNHLNHLMKLFEQFELNLRLYRQRHDIWTTSLEVLTAQIEASFKRTFKEKYFRQFLTIVPGFYLHKWEMMKGRLTLLIEIPSDANEQMQNERLALQTK